jgi:GDP-4-dehydro-6-deoxy-D-mannose reductase
MKVLITGACGFVGKHVVNELAANGHEPIGMDIGEAPPQLPPQRFVRGTITEGDVVARIIAELKPDACLHLAGWAATSNGTPRTIMDVNLIGTLNVLEGFRRAGSPARILCVSSAHVYGMKARPDPVREEDNLAPETVYAVSKAAADQLTRLYASQYGLNAMVARPHNHIGPGQSPNFAIPAFARQINAIRHGALPVMKVGNLDNRRDFTDVRDVARAYRLLLEKGQPGRAYNITSGRELRIGDILDLLCKLAGVTPEITRDEALYRPRDQNPILDIGRIRQDTGWAAQIPIEQTLADILGAA